jgi:Leucine-rich repeat (LRR) protein
MRLKKNNTYSGSNLRQSREKTLSMRDAQVIVGRSAGIFWLIRPTRFSAFMNFCKSLVAAIVLLLSSSQLGALQINDDTLPAEIQESAQRFLDRIENPIPPAGKKSIRRRLHKRNEKGQIVSLNLRDVQFAEGELQLVGKLIHLETLDLGSSNVTDEDLSLLAGLENLRELSLESTNIDGRGIAALRHLEHLQSLSLRRTKIGDANLGILALPESLRELNLRGNKITDEGLRQLRPIASVAVLRLGDTQIGDAGLLQLKNWEGLMGVTLDDTSVTDAGLQEFSKLEKFHWMKSAESTADELVSRLEKGEHAAAAAMCCPGVIVPAQGKLRLEKLEKIEPSFSDRQKNRRRYHLEMDWTLDAGKHQVLFADFRVERGTVFITEVGINK